LDSKKNLKFCICKFFWILANDIIRISFGEWLQKTLHVFGSKTQFLAIGLAILWCTTSFMYQQPLGRFQPSILGAYKSKLAIQYYAILCSTIDHYKVQYEPLKVENSRKGFCGLFHF